MKYSYLETRSHCVNKSFIIVASVFSITDKNNCVWQLPLLKYPRRDRGMLSISIDIPVITKTDNIASESIHKGMNNFWLL
jgi:hypothetical protein